MPRLLYGGDYNPEQWPEEVRASDAELMTRAGITMVTVGVFAWSMLEPAPGTYDFGWLDRTMDCMAERRIGVALATPTASPPPWFTLAHPEAMPVRADGVRLSHGSRDTYCASAPAYRDASRAIAAALADRYRGHPALAMWHVHNEYGTSCHCDLTGQAFRGWLRARYGDLDRLNEAWTTAFWSQRYTGWAQIRPPLATQYLPNPAQVLDFRRFTSDELLAAYVEQRDILRAATPGVPVTTNFVLGDWVPVDHARWSREVDLVAIDHYPSDPGPGAEDQAAFAADLARGWARLGTGRPDWLLMETAPNLIYAGDRMHAKEPGRMARQALAAVARGSGGAMYFQWRAPRGGAELFHSALVPHAGPDSRVFREAVALGERLDRVAEVAGGVVSSQVAIVYDEPSAWALQAPGLPSDRLDHHEEARRAHRAFWRLGITTDVVGGLADAAAPPPVYSLAGSTDTRLVASAARSPARSPASSADRATASLSDRTASSLTDSAAYSVIVLPAHYLIPLGAQSKALWSWVRAGGHLVVTFMSGIAGQDTRIHAGGYPGALRDLLGVRVEEFHPLGPDEQVRLCSGATGDLWSETVHATDAKIVSRYAGGVLDGRPAITRNNIGRGAAWYVSTRLDEESWGRWLGFVANLAGVRPVRAGLPPGVEVVVRRDGEREWLFAMNHTRDAQDVPADGVDLLTGATVTGSARIPAGGAAVIRLHGAPLL